MGLFILHVTCWVLPIDYVKDSRSQLYWGRERLGGVFLLPQGQGEGGPKKKILGILEGGPCSTSFPQNTR